MGDRSRGHEEPPAFLHAAAHPLRWRLLLELAGGDRQVHELTALLGQSQNLVSYHLGRLRKTGLVTTRRSTADRRDTYYLLDVGHCRKLLTGVGAALHPALRLTPPESPAAARARVLFLCSGNSSRSQMAEALLNRRTSGAVEAHSAGSRPKPIHPHAVAVMRDIGIDLSDARSKHLDEYADRSFDHVITLCDRVREVCPEFPGRPRAAHWSMPDPSADPAGYPAFVQVAAEIADRIELLLHVIAADAPTRS